MHPSIYHHQIALAVKSRGGCRKLHSKADLHPSLHEKLDRCVASDKVIASGYGVSWLLQERI
jgi:hypothetical protein